jgi:hypothetical protein
MPGDAQHLGALLSHGIDDTGQQIRRVLRVGISEYEELAVRDTRARGTRPLFAEPAGLELRRVDHTKARIGGRDAAGNRRRVVGRMVVDDNDLDRRIARRKN